MKDTIRGKVITREDGTKYRYEWVYEDGKRMPYFERVEVEDGERKE